MEKLTVEFTVADRAEFERRLQEWDLTSPNTCTGYRIDAGLDQREALRRFSSEMEQKLRKNDWKSDWRDKPIEALFKLLLVEIEEFKVMYEYFPVHEARRELVDIANFALIVWDRLKNVQQNIAASHPAQLIARGEMEYARSFARPSGDEQRDEIRQSLPAGTPDGQRSTAMVSRVDAEPGHDSQS